MGQDISSADKVLSLGFQQKSSFGTTYDKVTDLKNKKESSHSHEVYEACESLESMVHMSAYEGGYSAPKPRSGHFTAAREDWSEVFVGYGVCKSGELLCDIWSYNNTTRIWRELKLSGQKKTPRTGSRAVVYNNLLIVFGGFVDNKYVADLHIVNLETCVVSDVLTSNEGPSGRVTPVMHVIDRKLVLWGGYNGSWPNELNILNLASLQWKTVPSSVSGRTNISSVVIDNQIYCYGGSNSKTLVVIDATTLSITEKQLDVTSPPSDITGCRAISIGHYIFFVGRGQRDNETCLYACDIDLMTWNSLKVDIDRELTTTSSTNTVESFLCNTKMYNISILYSPSLRGIFLFPSHPGFGFSTNLVFDVSESISEMNLKKDLSIMLGL